MEPWYKNPTFLIIGGIAVFGAVILLRNQNASTSAPSSSTPSTSTSSGSPTSSTTSQDLSGAGSQFPPFFISPMNTSGNPMQDTGNLSAGIGATGSGFDISAPSVALPYYYSSSGTPFLPSNTAQGTNFLI